MKQGVALSVQYLVGLVLTLVLFSLAVVLVYSFFGRASQGMSYTQGEIDARLDAMSCVSPDRICISGNRGTFERSSLAVIGLFLYNRLTEDSTYHVYASLSRVERQGTIITEPHELQPGNSTFAYPVIDPSGPDDFIASVVIPSRETVRVPLIIPIPRSVHPGVYEYTVTIRYNVGASQEGRDERRITITIV